MPVSQNFQFCTVHTPTIHTQSHPLYAPKIPRGRISISLGGPGNRPLAMCRTNPCWVSVWYGCIDGQCGWNPWRPYFVDKLLAQVTGAVGFKPWGPTGAHNQFRCGTAVVGARVPGLALFHDSVIDHHRGSCPPSPLARCIQIGTPCQRWIDHIQRWHLCPEVPVARVHSRVDPSNNHSYSFVPPCFPFCT